MVDCCEYSKIALERRAPTDATNSIAGIFMLYEEHRSSLLLCVTSTGPETGERKWGGEGRGENGGEERRRRVRGGRGEGELPTSSWESEYYI